MKRKPPQQPNIDNDLPAREWLDEYDKWNSIQKDKPITKASRKLYDFVNACVADPDFLQSPGLLHLLLVVRDVLADNPTENWTLEDYLAPIESGIKSKAASQKNRDIRQRCQREWIEQKALTPNLKKFNFAAAFIVQLKLEIANDEGSKNKNKNKKLPVIKTITDNWLNEDQLDAYRQSE